MYVLKAIQIIIKIFIAGYLFVSYCFKFISLERLLGRCLVVCHWFKTLTLGRLLSFFILSGNFFTKSPLPFFIIKQRQQSGEK